MTGAHEPVGDRPTACFGVNFAEVAQSCGCRQAIIVSDAEGIVSAMDDFRDTDGPCFIEVRVNMRMRSDLGRPKESPIEDREAFMTACGSEKRR